MKIKDGIKKVNTGLDAIKRAPIVDYDTGLKCVRIQDISQGKEFEDWGFTETTETDRKRFVLKNGDILVARTGATVGVSTFIKKNLNAVHNNGTIRLQVNNRIDAHFLYYTFQTKDFLQYINNISCVATQPNLRIEGLLRFTIPDYSLDKQKKVADILSAYDDLIDNNNKRIKLLEQMAEHLYKEWFERFRFPGYEGMEIENGIPKGWQYVKLSDIADIIMGQSPESIYYNFEEKGLPFHQGVGSYGDNYLKNDMYSMKGNRLAEADSIIFSVRAPVGRININIDKVLLGRGLAAINAKNGNNAFLYWALKVAFRKEDIIGNGSIFTSVKKDDIEKFKIIYPSVQLENSFNEFARKIEKQIRNIFLKNENLLKQRDLLLPRLMSGKLEVK